MDKDNNDRQWFTTDSEKEVLLLNYALGVPLPPQHAWCKFCKGRVAKVVGVVVDDKVSHYAIECEVCHARFLESCSTFVRKYVGGVSTYGEIPPMYGHVPEGKIQVLQNAPPAKVISRPEQIKKPKENIKQNVTRSGGILHRIAKAIAGFKVFA